MKLGDSGSIKPHHQSCETGLDLWDNTPSYTHKNNYQLQELEEMEQNKYEEIRDIDDENSDDIETPIPKTMKVNDEITYDPEHNKARDSLEHLNETVEPVVISRKSTISCQSVIYHGSESPQPPIKEHEPAESTDSEEEYSRMPELIKDAKQLHDSTILSLVGSPNTLKGIKPSANIRQSALDEQFFIESQQKQNQSMQLKTRKNVQYVGDEGDVRDDDLYDGQKEQTPHKLTAENLMFHNHEIILDDMEKNGDDLAERYIAMSDEHSSYIQQSLPRTVRQPMKEKKKTSLSKKVKYMTAVGAFCAFGVLIGWSIYNFVHSPNSVTKGRTPSGSILSPSRRPRPPRMS